MIYVEKSRTGECVNCGSPDEVLFLSLGDTEIKLCTDCADTLAVMINDRNNEG